ncbi:DUF2306 domain-containing protein [Sphingomonas sp. LT1P40]|uniref:DUF2306 domain-containing protein n=1 Tax=Alteristakelama amylovorans TaxID=3096166 RepID=UPI002FCA880C
MASIAQTPRTKPLSADRYEQILAFGAIALLLAVIVALARGYREWALVPWQVWPHLATVAVALALTPVILLGRRGDQRHRWLGRIWVGAMFLSALLSFGLTGTNPGHFSFIHLISAYVVVSAPLIWWSAATHRITTHRRSVRGMVTGALLIAGFFTFPFDRLMGRWLFG